MSRMFRLFLIVLGLSIFTLPKQLISAQTTAVCCATNSTNTDDCCSSSMHSCSSDGNSTTQKDNCGDDCANCNSCTVHFVINFISLDSKFEVNLQIYNQNLKSDYDIPYFSFALQNIWQPPKIG